MSPGGPGSPPATPYVSRCAASCPARRRPAQLPPCCPQFVSTLDSCPVGVARSIVPARPRVKSKMTPSEAPGWRYTQGSSGRYDAAASLKGYTFCDLPAARRWLGQRRQGHLAGAPLLPRTVHPLADGHGALARPPYCEERSHAPCM